MTAISDKRALAGETTNLAFVAGQTLVAWLPLLALGTASVVSPHLVDRSMPAWLHMWLIAGALLLGFKWLTWRSLPGAIRDVAGWRNLAYFTLWPGLDARSFVDRDRPASKLPRTEIWAGLRRMFVGASLVWGAARFAPHELIAGWIGMVGLVLIAHFGAFRMLAWFWRSRGVAARPLMSDPMGSTSLGELWSRRWNTAFQAMAARHLLRPFRSPLGLTGATLATFAVSGLLHDLVLSVPVGAGFGLPTAYFVLQGIGVLTERSALGKRLGLGKGPRGRVFTLFVALGPLPWTFHPAFVRGVVLPFLGQLGALG